jgi:hypothetical protein
MKKDDNIKEELKNISPFLASLRKPDEGFEVPKDYFQNFESNLMARIKAEEAVEAWGISETEQPLMPNLNWLQSIWAWMTQPQIGVSLLAMVVIVGIGFAVFQINEKNAAQFADLSTDEALASLNVDDVSQYVEDNVDDFSEELLISNLENIVEKNITTLPVETELQINEIQEYIEDNIGEFDETLLLEAY